MASRARESWRRSGRWGEEEDGRRLARGKADKMSPLPSFSLPPKKRRRALPEIPANPLLAVRKFAIPASGTVVGSPLSTSRAALSVYANVFVAACVVSASRASTSRARKRETARNRWRKRERERHGDAKRIHVGGGGDGGRRDENMGGWKRSPAGKDRERSIDDGSLVRTNGDDDGDDDDAGRGRLSPPRSRSVAEKCTAAVQGCIPRRRSGYRYAAHFARFGQARSFLSSPSPRSFPCGSSALDNYRESGSDEGQVSAGTRSFLSGATATTHSLQHFTPVSEWEKRPSTMRRDGTT